jgi:hypothetical protein
MEEGGGGPSAHTVLAANSSASKRLAFINTLLIKRCIDNIAISLGLGFCIQWNAPDFFDHMLIGPNGPEKHHQEADTK